MKKIYLVSCVRKKKAHPAPAKELYISDWFKKAKEYVETISDSWYILSAKYGLLKPGRMIRPYDKILKEMSVNERRHWACQVLTDLEKISDFGDTVVILAGKKYREFLLKPLKSYGFKAEIPFEGLGIGQQKSWLRKANKLLHPDKLFTRAKILSGTCPVPEQSGVYGWYFRHCPEIIPTADCHKYSGLTLLYVGISPRKPPENLKKTSSSNIRTRLRMHMNGNASGSTLRLSLGCVLAKTLGLELRRIGKKGRITFADGEELLSEWLSRNALVAWVFDDRPWETEEILVQEISLPLNLKGNENHPFHPVLSEMRSKARARARKLPIFT